MWLYSVAKQLLLPVYRLAFRIRVEGVEHVPTEGGVILCCNHFRGHDPIVLGLVTPRNIFFMAKQELFHKPVLGWLLRSGLGAFPVKRGAPDRAALKRSMEVLEGGGCFGIFPEGTRNRTGELLAKAEPGTAYLALKSGAPVIPVGISGSYQLFRPLTIRFGAPIDMSPYRSTKMSSATVRRVGDVIMAGIRSLLTGPGPTGSEGPGQ